MNIKKILILVVIPFLSFGQVEEDLNVNTKTIEIQLSRIMELENDLTYLRHQLDRHHDHYTIGVGLQLLGGVLMATTQEEAGIQVGGLFALIGSFVMIRSDRFFASRHTNRANRKRRVSAINSSDDFVPLIKKINKK